ncbi:MAG TPA: TonB-dependent receptor [Silvibacterium sp.]|nr:TonB-dependent receptor [Silvibacterium sp.]
MKSALVLVLLAAMPVWAQVNYGEVHLKISNPNGAAVGASVELTCSGNGYEKEFSSDAAGEVDVLHLPYGAYQVQVREPGFAPFSEVIEVRSPLPLSENVRLRLASVMTKVKVTAADTLIDPENSSSLARIGSKQIQQRLSSLPGRSVQNLVVSQPGWLYEGNAVLHPRGSEYQTQFVVDGVPLTDNRSPSFGPEIEADDLDSMSVYTAGFPAEYGRKMGGVVELETRRQSDPGLHGRLVLSGGSYDTASSFGQLQQAWGANTLSASAAGSMTSHYLNPVVPQNYTNTGTTGDFSSRYERNLTSRDRMGLSVRHEFSRFLIPNELVQEQAGQIQNGDNFETIGIAHYQHVLSADSLFALSGMVRDNSNNLYSNQKSIPIIASEHNHFREGYFKGAFSRHYRNQEIKAGLESDAIFLHQRFSYVIANPNYFDSGTPPSLEFAGDRPDLEQAAFAEDSISLGRWTVAAGVRWDHYQLLLNENAFSPRISIGRYFRSRNMVLHTSYDRVFQTPSSENILISSSPHIGALSSEFLRLPVQPSRGNYYEAGLAKGFRNRMRLDANVYRRDARNYADDDQLLNTGVSYPIAFNRAVIYGAEGKLSIVQMGKLSGFVSYSYMVGKVWFPVTGGLFLGSDASNAASQISGHFPDTQDQRNTLGSRIQYQIAPRLWIAAGEAYGSGLPFEFDGTEGQALAEYGPEVISRFNFARGRVRPLLAVDSSVGVDVYKNDKVNMQLQADGENLNDRLNVLDFGGLFSGNAIGPGRSFGLRLTTSF